MNIIIPILIAIGAAVVLYGAGLIIYDAYRATNICKDSRQKALESLRKLHTTKETP